MDGSAKASCDNEATWVGGKTRIRKWKAPPTHERRRRGGDPGRGPRSREPSGQGREICRRCELRWSTRVGAEPFMTKSSLAPGDEALHNADIGKWAHRCHPWLNSSPRSCSGCRQWRFASSAWLSSKRPRLRPRPNGSSPAPRANRPSRPSSAARVCTGPRSTPRASPWPLARQALRQMGKPAEPAMRVGFSPLGLFVACERGVRAAMFIRPQAVSPWDYGCV